MFSTLSALTSRRAPADDDPDDPDDLDRAGRRRNVVLWLTGLSGLLVVTMIVAVSLGPFTVAPSTVWQVIGHHTLGVPAVVQWTEAEDNIVWLVRAPRVLLGAAVGAGLAVSGVALQALVRNVLADPFLLGISSGASTGAAITILFGLGAGALGASTLSVSAFAGALLATAVVFTMARTGGGVTSLRLVLAGIAVAYALSALTSFLIFASNSPQAVRAVLFWMLGDLTQARWSSLPVAATVAVTVTAALVLWGRRLDALAIGDDTARTLGVAPARFRTQVFVLVSVCVGGVVAVSGAVGFVGLVIPHLARRLVGAAHRRVVAVSALLGAIFLVWADVAARTVMAPRELPLGVLTAMVGTPFLLLLVRRLHRVHPKGIS